MARIRTVKPELFLDEELGTHSGDHLALFVGLWTQADKLGRLEDRPVRLKAALFPYRSVDVEALLGDLVRIGKIVRYTVDGDRYIAIPGFTDHQRCHPKEPESRIPPPPRQAEAGEITGEPGKYPAGREKPGCIPSSPVGREGKGREGKEISAEPVPLPPAPDAEFFARCQARRSAIHGAEEMPPASFAGWWRRAIELVGGDVAKLDAAYAVFLADSFWRQNRHPFQAFIGGKNSPDKWRQYVAQAVSAPPKQKFQTVTADEDPYASERSHG